MLLSLALENSVPATPQLPYRDMPCNSLTSFNVISSQIDGVVRLKAYLLPARAVDRIAREAVG
ncbi:hypothetical protein [Brucella gallinifaecis]|uniref:hypothetical protein n=1 Tax=Brucella gallinifaecis TaxID=215590 RepID=UPI00236259A2|nr:hypothetical protein [Brucella gallinifaecis]